MINTNEKFHERIISLVKENISKIIDEQDITDVNVSCSDLKQQNDYSRRFGSKLVIHYKAANTEKKKYCGLRK